MLKLALAEPLNAEDLGVGSERARLEELIRRSGIDLLDSSLQVLGQVLIVPVNAYITQCKDHDMIG